MSKDSFHLRVITPEGLMVDEQVQSALLPSMRGEMGVLPGHVNYAGLLSIGVLQYLPIYDQTAKGMVVEGGFCTFSDDCLTVTANAAHLPEVTTIEELGRRKEDLLKEMATLDAHAPRFESAARDAKVVEALEKVLKQK